MNLKNICQYCALANNNAMKNLYHPKNLFLHSMNNITVLRFISNIDINLYIIFYGIYEYYIIALIVMFRHTLISCTKV